MPEGDTVWQTANRLHAALTGGILTVCDIRVPRYATVDLSGRTVDKVLSRGKHLLIRVGAHSIHTHLKMEGAWHVYRPGARWTRPGFQARIVLGTDTAVAVGFSLGVTEVLDRAAEDSAVGHLGPDLLGPDWDPELAVRNIVRDGQRPIGLALLDQRNLAGLGNVYRNELCFLRGVHPRTPVEQVQDIPAMIDLAYRMLQANKDRVARTTTGDRRPGRRMWVYGCAGKPCLRCGTLVVGEDTSLERRIYVCPHCQK